MSVCSVTDTHIIYQSHDSLVLFSTSISIISITVKRFHIHIQRYKIVGYLLCIRQLCVRACVYVL